MKVKDLRKHIYDAYMEELMSMIDLDQFIKEEIEGKENKGRRRRRMRRMRE